MKKLIFALITIALNTSAFAQTPCETIEAKIAKVKGMQAVVTRAEVEAEQLEKTLKQAQKGQWAEYAKSVAGLVAGGGVTYYGGKKLLEISFLQSMGDGVPAILKAGVWSITAGGVYLLFRSGSKVFVTANEISQMKIELAERQARIKILAKKLENQRNRSLCN